MRLRWPRRCLAISMLLVAGALSAATPAKLRVVEAWSRATPAVAPVAGGFLTVTNAGKADDRLLRVESRIAKRVEIHEMRNDGGIMRMRQVTDGLVVPAQGQLVLAPGGYHLMLIAPVRALAEGESFDAVLVFQRAGKLKARFSVRGLGAQAP